jgi:hypothetical protein
VTIETDVSTREVRFNLKKQSGFNEPEVKKALKGQGFPEVTVRAARAEPDKMTG